MLGLPARMRVMRLQYSVAMCAARSRSSAWGIDISNVAPCTLITTLLIGGGSVSAFIPALCAVWPQEGRGFFLPYGGSCVCRMCPDRSSWRCHRNVDTYTWVGCLLWWPE